MKLNKPEPLAVDAIQTSAASTPLAATTPTVAAVVPPLPVAVSGLSDMPKETPLPRISEIAKEFFTANDFAINKLLRSDPGSKLPAYAYKDKLAKTQEFVKNIKTSVAAVLEDRDKFSQKCIEREAEVLSSCMSFDKRSMAASNATKEAA